MITGGCFKDKQLHELIKRDVDRSIKIARAKATKLHQATTDHIGLELMHQFVLDLLGHDTSAAKIFIQKVLACAWHGVSIYICCVYNL